MAIKSFNEMIPTMKAFRLEGKAHYYNPERPLKNGITVEEVSEFFYGIIRAAAEYAARINTHHSGNPY